MKKLIALIPFSFVLCTLYLFSCDTTEPPPKEEKPPGYQEDIPWPSLADSPWPMNHGNPQSTGRSKYLGPRQGIIINRIPASEMESGIALGKDSTIYFASSTPGYLYSVGYDGIEKWKLLLGYKMYTTPLIGSDGTIFIANGIKQIIAVAPDGTIKWQYENESFIVSLGINIGKDGTLYFVDQSATLNAIGMDGSLKWQLTDDRISRTSYSALTFSPDGKTIYIQGISVLVLAVDVDQKSVKWTFGNDGLLTSPIIDADGNIYFSSHQLHKATLYCLKPNGTIGWSKDVFARHKPHNEEPTIDKFGNTYWGFDSLYSFDYKGEMRWKVEFPANYFNFSPLVCDEEGNVYLGLSKDLYDLKIVSFSSEGYLNWEITINDERLTGDSPAITENGLLIFPTFRSNNILVIK